MHKYFVLRIPSRNTKYGIREKNMRTAQIERETKETTIQLTLDLDGTGQYQIATGVGFLDHMLTHVAAHGLFDLTVQATGDLHIDPHHTVEDVALVFVAVDLSGRPYCVTEVEWTAPTVGGIPATLIPHFIESFAVTARASIHARVLYGRDDHHKAEGLFKALGRALDAATRLDSRRGGEIPSTKGTL
jgi:imidazoleglycerol-phosphate dehydratase